MNNSKLIKYTLLFTAIAVISGCDTEPIANSIEGVEVNLIPTIGTETSISRALPIVFDGATLTPSNGLKTVNTGMWLCERIDSYEPYSLGMDNMKCIYNICTNPPSWTFHYGITPHYVLSVKPIGTGHDDLYLYAYSPYNADVDSPEAIPVQSGADELIYVNPIHFKSKASGESIDIPLNFNHAQACIEFRITPARTHYGIALTGLEIQDTDNGNPIIPQNSEFNIVTSEYNDGKTQFCDKLTYTSFIMTLPQYDSNMTPVKIYVPIIPFNGYEDKRFNVTFTFSNVKCTIPLSAINPDENGCMDFKQGYKYIYNLVLANETLYKSGEIITTWAEGPVTTIDL